MKPFLLLLASTLLAAPVTAAEIGSRHTWGHSTTHVRDGRSVSRSSSVGAYAEHSSGHSGGADFRRSEVGAFASSNRERYDFTSNSSSGFSETTTFSR